MSFIVKTHPLSKIEDDKFTIAVIAARYENKLVFVRRHGFDTWEMPGGHRENNESILETAKRELYEETGAAIYRIAPVCAYTVEEDGNKLYGVLFVADVFKLGELPKSEIEEVKLFEDVPNNLTFPKIQAKLSVISLPHELCGGVGKDISIRHAQYIDIADICTIYSTPKESTGDEDADELIRIEEEFRMRTAEHRLRTTVEKANHRIFIAYDGIRPIGICILKLISKNNAENEFSDGNIESIMVLPTHRRVGIGAHLTNCAIEFMREVGCRFTYVWIPAADEQLTKMATAQGFEYDGTREMTDSGTRLRYRKAIPD